MNGIEESKERLDPPFGERESVFYQADVDPILPTTYVCKKNRKDSVELLDRNDPTSVEAYLRDSFDVSKLDKVKKHLWLTGLPRIARTLNKQVGLGRSIVITEQADCHLIWQESSILIKPLPQILLDHRTWSEYICKPGNEEIYQSASGFLLSYIWMVCSESDFHIASDNKLLPTSVVDWQRWTVFAASVHRNIRLDQVSPRYKYGELRLPNLNAIHRLLAIPRGDMKDLIHGYRFPYTTYGTFFERNTKWLITATVYFGLVLAAMQVGLGTDSLSGSEYFVNACYGVSLLLILGPLGILAVLLMVFVVLFTFNALYAYHEHQVRKKYG